MYMLREDHFVRALILFCSYMKKSELYTPSAVLPEIKLENHGRTGPWLTGHAKESHVRCVCGYSMSGAY